jgi:hypothetical protein
MQLPLSRRSSVGALLIRRCIGRFCPERLVNLGHFDALLSLLGAPAGFAATSSPSRPEDRAALSEYTGAFNGYTVQRIRDLYEKELPHPDPGMQASIQELYKGLCLAGVPEP